MYAVDGEPYEAPNYTQIPNRFLDEQLADLSGSETKVLLYIMRRTYGFDKGSDAISLKQIAEGIKRKDGTPLDGGTGLSVSTVVTAIKGLVKRGLILTERRSSKEKGHQANLYRLNAVHGTPTTKIGEGPTTNSGVPYSENQSSLLRKSETQKKVGQKKDRQEKELLVGGAAGSDRAPEQVKTSPFDALEGAQRARCLEVCQRIPGIQGDATQEQYVADLVTGWGHLNLKHEASKCKDHHGNRRKKWGLTFFRWVTQGKYVLWEDGTTRPPAPDSPPPKVVQYRGRSTDSQKPYRTDAELNVAASGWGEYAEQVYQEQEGHPSPYAHLVRKRAAQ